MITSNWLNINSWPVKENTFLYWRFLDNVLDISISEEQKCLFTKIYWDKLDSLTKSLSELLDNIDIDNFKWEDLLALWLDILKIQENIKNIVSFFITWVLDPNTSTSSINNHTIVTYLKIWELIKNYEKDTGENPKNKATKIIIKLKNQVSTMNLSEMKYYWGELINLWDLIIRAIIKV